MLSQIVGNNLRGQKYFHENLTQGWGFQLPSFLNASTNHSKARSWLEERLTPFPEPVLTCSSSVYEWLHMLVHRIVHHKFSKQTEPHKLWSDCTISNHKQNHLFPKHVRQNSQNAFFSSFKNSFFSWTNWNFSAILSWDKKDFDVS